MAAHLSPPQLANECPSHPFRAAASKMDGIILALRIAAATALR